jgi:hypothetical protein
MQRLYRFFSSLQLTVGLLACSILLVFLGTLDQVHLGIRHAQAVYFESLIAVWPYPKQWPLADYLGWFHLALPGGYTLGILLIINLITAHFRYYQHRWQKSGIILIHLGLALLLGSQLITQLVQDEYFMWLDSGKSVQYIESFYENELALTRIESDGTRILYSIPTAQLEPDHTIEIPESNLKIEVKAFFKNTGIVPRNQLQETAPPMPFDQGIGADRDLVIWERAPTYRQNERNVASAIIHIHDENNSYGTWLVSTLFRARQPDGTLAPMAWPDQVFNYGGNQWEIALRFKRAYLPARISLIEFSHDRYPGTDIPFNFSSRIEVSNAQTGEQRETLIYMNHPMRYAGYTFYQASFGNGDRSSMLQVVRNPGRWLPYIASGVISLGLILQFTLSFLNYSRKRQPTK